MKKLRVAAENRRPEAVVMVMTGVASANEQMVHQGDSVNACIASYQESHG